MALGFEQLRVYQLSEQVADLLWEIARGWSPAAWDTLGKQLVRAGDSIGANIAEGFGRGTYTDNRRFVRITRGSLHEVRHFLRRAYRRGLVTSEQERRILSPLKELGPKLNAYLRSIGPPKAKPMTSDK